MATKRIAKIITDKKEIDFLLGLKEEDITLSFMMETFGKFDGKSRFNPYDIFNVPPNSYGPVNKRNKNSFKTTVGLWIFNIYFIQNELFDIFGYINETVGKKKFKNINKVLSHALLEDRIDTDQLEHYLMKTQKVMPYVSILCPGYTMKMLESTKIMNKKKAELYKKYKDRLSTGTDDAAVAASEMEKELMDYAAEYLDGDPSMDSFNSGARGDFGNNYKNMFLMKGAIADPDPDKGYDIMLSNYMDGVSKEEYHMLANSLAAGPYARAKKTETGGYLEKQFLSGYQHVTLDKPGSDCHTNKTLKVLLNKSNIESWLYSYMVEGSRLVELNSMNMDKYIGKEVKFRFSALCKSKTGICNVCMGNLPYKLDIMNIGAATPKIPSVLKMLSMKSFHASVVEFAEMDVMKAFGLK